MLQRICLEHDKVDMTLKNKQINKKHKKKTQRNLYIQGDPQKTETF